MGQNKEVRRADLIAALSVYALLLCAGWIVGSEIFVGLHAALPAVFLSFALILAPLVWFGFGAADLVRRWLGSPAARIAAASCLLLPYLISALALHRCDWRVAAVFFLIPVGLTILFEFVLGEGTGLSWRDLLAFAALALPLVFHLLNFGWAQPGLPKLLLTDVALYLYLVVRRLPRVGYDFHPRLSDLAIGAREWLFFAPIAIGIGLGLGIPSLACPLAAPAGAFGWIDFHTGIRRSARGALLSRSAAEPAGDPPASASLAADFCRLLRPRPFQQGCHV